MNNDSDFAGFHFLRFSHINIINTLRTAFHILCDLLRHLLLLHLTVQTIQQNRRHYEYCAQKQSLFSGPIVADSEQGIQCEIAFG